MSWKILSYLSTELEDIIFLSVGSILVVGRVVDRSLAVATVAMHILQYTVQLVIK